MFSSFALPFQLPNFAFGRRGQGVGIPPVKTYDVETGAERPARTLKHLLKINHANHSIIYHNLHFHNHAPHILGSAYILGAIPEQLTKIYDEESKNLEPWTDSPGEISKDDWRDFLGKRNYQRAYIDFFEDQLVHFGYDWKHLLEHYLMEGHEPLIYSLISGLGHPLIHLGYAYELSSRTVGIEALGLAACFHDEMPKYILDPSYTRPSSYKSTSTLQILQNVFADDRFDKLFDHQGSDNIPQLLSQNEDSVLDHWNAWQLPTTSEEIKASFAEIQRAAVALVVATHHPVDASSENNPSSDSTRKYDFFLLHLLTTSHALRILLPLIPAKFHIPLLRQWLFFTISAYISQNRPRIDLSLIEEYPIDNVGWKYVTHISLTSSHSADAHFVKGLRAMRVAEETWGAEDGYWVKAAVRLAKEFEGWGGFGALTQGYQPRAKD